MASTGRSLYATDGVVIRRPAARATQLADPKHTYLCFPSSEATEWRNADDAETLAVFQELALRYAMEQTHSTVRAVLLRANKKCYNDAHAFLQRHMQHAATEGDQNMRSPTLPRVVMFPKLMKFPAVAIVSGSDATFSDVWMTPLCQVIHRSFPLILVVREKMDNVRHMVEWVLERLDDYAGMKQREESWLGQQIDAWYAFSEQRQASHRPVAVAASLSATPEPPRLRSRRARTSLDSVPSNHDDSDEDYAFFDGGESTSGSDDDGDDDDDVGEVRSRKKSGTKRKRRGKTKRRLKYVDLLLDDLLETLSDRMEILQRVADLTLTWTATLRDVIQEDLRKQLERCDGDLERSIQCYHEIFEWIASRILAYRELRSLPNSIRASTAEFTLATLAYGILSQFLAFVTASTTQTTADRELVAKWTREIQRQIERLEDTNHLHQFDVPQYEQVASQLDPYLLICIEQLDQLNLQALRDFVDLWSRFVDRHDGASGAHSTRVGFILGVTTTTSQTLRQLGLSVMRRLDMQFFPLDDSKTRSEDILDALAVQNNFPLCLSGDALRLLDERHLTSQSLAAFTQVLEFFALSHFQDTPWSFLSRFAFDVHRQKPLFNDLPQHSALRKWIVRKDFRGRSLRDVLGYFSDDCVNTLLAKFRAPKAASKDRFGPLEQELRRFSDERANWIVGWRCLQLTFAWLQLDKRCEDYVECLAMALDGRAADLNKVEWCIIKIKVEPLPMLMGMMEDWSVAAATSRDASLQREIQDLIMLTAHILDTPNDPETARMRPLFRNEVSDFFRERILSLMVVQQPAPATSRAIVCDWMFAVTNLAAIRTHVTINLHEDTVASLTRLDDEAYQQSTAAGDLSLAFLHYREHSTLQLSVADWFAAFADAVREELGKDSGAVISKAELNARFARALATLRLWGYINGPDGVRGSGRRHRDARVHKRIFM